MHTICVNVVVHLWMKMLIYLFKIWHTHTYVHMIFPIYIHMHLHTQNRNLLFQLKCPIQALLSGCHPDKDFEGNSLPAWLDRLKGKPIAGQVSNGNKWNTPKIQIVIEFHLLIYIYIYLCLQSNFAPYCPVLIRHTIRLSHGSGGQAALVELRGDWKFLREAFALRTHWTAKDCCHLCIAHSPADPIRRNRCPID